MQVADWMLFLRRDPSPWASACLRACLILKMPEDGGAIPKASTTRKSTHKSFQSENCAKLMFAAMVSPIAALSPAC